MQAPKPVCEVCGRKLRTFDVIDVETGEKVGEETACLDEWRESHQTAD